MRLVQPGRTLTSSVFFFSRSTFTSFVCCARHISVNRNFPVKPVAVGSINIFAYCSLIHFFIIGSSQFFLNPACARTSQESCSSWKNFFTWPLNIIIGETQGMPSTKAVSCTVYWRLLSSEAAEAHHTSLISLPA